MSAGDLSDTSTWLPLNELAPGFDANRAPASVDLDGRTITTLDERGTRTAHRFRPGRVAWESVPADDPAGARSGDDPCEVVRVDGELYYAQFQHAADPSTSVSLVLDLRAGTALSVVATLGRAAPGTTAVQQEFVRARIEGAASADADGPAPTTELIGRRVQWVYSAVHAYEHVYLSPHWYTWQCLAGPERGLADTDENTAWRIRPGVYVFAWREKVVPCGSVTVADHRDAKSLRSHGVLFGADADTGAPMQFTFGAHGRLLSTTVHPAELDPAR